MTPKGNIIEIKIPLKGRIDAENPLHAMSKPSGGLLYREMGIYHLTTNGREKDREKVLTREMMKAGGFYLTGLERGKTDSYVELEEGSHSGKKIYIHGNGVDHLDEKSLIWDFYRSYQNAGICKFF